MRRRGPTKREPTSARPRAKTIDRLIRRLELIVALLARNSTTEAERPISEQIWLLKSLGVDTGDIASIVAKPSNFVSAIARTMPKDWPRKKGRKKNAKTSKGG